MSIVAYNEESVSNLKNSFNNCSTEINSSLVNICRELSGLEAILNTPKLSKTVPSVVSYYNKKINHLQRYVASFNKDFDTIINEYHDFNIEVNRMVGGNNVK